MWGWGVRDRDDVYPPRNVGEHALMASNPRISIQAFSLVSRGCARKQVRKQSSERTPYHCLPDEAPGTERIYVAAEGERMGEMAGEQGFEPRLPDPESGVLPLDDSPMSLWELGTGSRLASCVRRSPDARRPVHSHQVIYPLR